MTTNEAIQIAEPIVKVVVDLISENNYQSIPDHVDFKDGISVDLLKAAIEEFMADAEISHIDKYDGTFKNFHYDDYQFGVYFYKNDTGFCIDYDFMTNGEINDLTLQMEFLFIENNGVKAYIEDCHVL